MENGIGFIVTIGFPHPGPMRTPGQEGDHAGWKWGAAPQEGQSGVLGSVQGSVTGQRQNVTDQDLESRLQPISQGPDAIVSSLRIPTSKVEFEKS